MDIDGFLPHMRDVVRCDESLRELNLTWRMIEASAKMNCAEEASGILPMMAATREGFQRLETELVSSLVHQKVANVMAELGTRARHVIDIIVRNLYERTADVGFLATDRELCEYVAGIGGTREAVVERLRAYRDKYTVYDEIVLLDTRGAVLAHIDAHSPIEGSRDPLVAQSLASDTYVESFRATDLRPGRPRSLVYSRRMLDPRGGQPVGVLCLVFGFETEMASIFASRHGRDGRSNIVLLDADNRVIASADEQWLPLGGVVPVNRSAQPELCIHAGRTYLVQTFVSDGYQGYAGPPGWQGQVMIPLEVAFSGRAGGVLERLDEAVAEGLLSHARSFCPPLYEIVTAADGIRRVVWNGQVMTAGEGGDLRRLKTVLEQISDTGARSNELFARSIRDLYDTVLASSLASAEFTTQLLVELLDRNLYERSDDCRWWAMTPELRSALAQPALDESERRMLTALLEGIHALYTVYTRLVVYDRSGRIVAASEPRGRSSVVDGTIEDDTLRAVLALPDSQSYHVTPFRPSALCDGLPTYVYHAAVRALNDEATVVGGIGIAFNSAAEFEAMLSGGIGAQPDMSALFVDRRGHVIASTDASCPVGGALDLPPEFLTLGNGGSASRVIVRDGRYTLVGCSVSNGYREFKRTDGYVEDVLAVAFQSLGEVRAPQLTARHRALTQLAEGTTIASGAEFATFFIDAALMALPAEHVIEALPARDLTAVSTGEVPHRIGMLARRREGRVEGYLWAFDLGSLLSGRPTGVSDTSQVVVLRHQEVEIGLLVSELHGVPAFAAQRITRAPQLGGGAQALVSHLIKANEGRLMIQVLDVARLFTRLGITKDVPHGKAPAFADSSA
ncbi:chemotaxis protein CheW [Methylibium sp.]|uniref:chemotaxis protein CheW n=1 Tax=Methylibium sp. TaxID=2067992 RepID=UPI003D108420